MPQRGYAKEGKALTFFFGHFLVTFPSFVAHLFSFLVTFLRVPLLPPPPSCSTVKEVACLDSETYDVWSQKLVRGHQDRA